jgi:FkbM family methyltransferase
VTSGAPVGAGLLDRLLIAYARGPEHPAKIRMVRWLIRRLTAGRLHFRYACSATIAIDPSDYIGWAILRTGHYEPASLDLALRILQAMPGLFVDVGANFGWYSCAAASIAGATVIAIEPDCGNCAALRANLALSGQEKAVIVNAAAGASVDAARIVRRAPGNSGTSAIAAAGVDDAHHGDWVATMPLDLLLARIVVPPIRPVLVKMDVEGFEPQVLAGFDLCGPFRPRNIIMEYEPALSETTWGGLSAIEEFFSRRGYDITDVFGRALGGPVDIPEANIWARER